MKIRAYNSTGEVKYVPNREVTFTLGTRLILTCNVTGLSEGNKVVSYRWFLNCTQLRCQIRNEDPYYRVVMDTLLVDVTSLDQGGRYYCFVTFSNTPQAHASTSRITVAGQCMHKNCYKQYCTTHHCHHIGNPVPFLCTPTSLLLEHSVLTDVQHATGRSGQQWISCWSGGQGTGPEIQMGSNEVNISNRTANSVTIGLGIHHPNGLYCCLSARSQRRYFSLYLGNSGKYV